MIAKEQMEQVLMTAKQTGADFAELFFEDQDETNVVCSNGSMEGVKTKHIHGVGLYLIQGIKSVYVYTNDTTYASLKQLAVRASEMLLFYHTKVHAPSDQVLRLYETPVPNPNRIVEYPSTVSYQDKMKVLRDGYQMAASSGTKLLSAQLDYVDTQRRIFVANTKGLFARDERVTSRVRFGITTGDESGSFYHWEDYTRARGFEAFRGNEEYLQFSSDLVKRIENMRNARQMEPGRMPVIMEAGACGTLWHECCGHTLEATAIASRQSFFVDKMGERVASDKVTLVDDGTIPNYYGSDGIDDEGHRKQRNVLIENGILRSYMCDRLHGKMIGMESTGNGRRQNYTFAPVARMTNTFLEAGTDKEEDLIRSIPYGLYVKSLGGGFGGTQFSLQVNEGFLIKNGQIDRQVKGMMLSGNGAQIMHLVDGVGNRVGFDGGGFCGASSGLVPVTSFQPMVRISEMSVG